MAGVGVAVHARWAWRARGGLLVAAGAINLASARVSGRLQQALAYGLVLLLAAVVVAALGFADPAGEGVAHPAEWTRAVPVIGLGFFRLHRLGDAVAGLLPSRLARIRSRRSVPRASLVTCVAAFLGVAVLEGTGPVSSEWLLRLAGQNFFLLYAPSSPSCGSPPGWRAKAFGIRR